MFPSCLQDVFTISVGNLPPGATVLIKVTFVSELVVKDGSILFSLPGSVAPWQEDAALKQTSQVGGAWADGAGLTQTSEKYKKSVNRKKLD